MAYKKRKETVEPVFGIIKSAMGFRQFLLRGMRKVALEIHPSIRIIVFDTFEDSQIPGKLITAGACDFVAKTRNPDAGISDLLKNIRYLAREKVLPDGQ